MADFLEDLSPEADEADVNASLERLRAARGADAEQAATKEFDPENKAAQGSNAIGKWLVKLPKNVGIGMLDAAINSAQTIEDARAEGKKALGEDSAGSVGALRTVGPGSIAEMFVRLPPIPEEVMQPLRQFREEFAAGSDTSDAITQGVAQFAVPFAGWARAFGVARGQPILETVARIAGAETAATASVFAPHDGRLADLVKLGQHAENRFGEMLRTLAPDDGLVNQYINWMTDRDDEGEWEGRFKNSVDGLVGSAAVAGLVKTAAVSFRKARSLFQQATAERGLPVQAAGTDPARSEAYELAADALFDRVSTMRAEAGGSAKTANKPIDMATVVDDLDRTIPPESPYRVLVDKLKGQNLKGKIRFLSDKEYAERAGTTSTGKSFTRSYPENDEILVNLDKAATKGRVGIGYTVMHELTHAGTVRSMKRSPELLEEFKVLADQTKEASPNSAAKYGYTNAYEFVAEAFSNMKFQSDMKKAGTWEPFLKKIGAIFGVTGASLKVLETVVQQEAEARA